MVQNDPKPDPVYMYHWWHLSWAQSDSSVTALVGSGRGAQDTNLKKIYGCISFFVILINSYILLEINNKDQSTLIIIIIIISRIF